MKILDRTEMHNPILNIDKPALSVEEVLEMQQEVRGIRVTDGVKQYIIAIVAATRNDRNAALGISPRGSIALYKSAKAFAYIYGREYATPDDVKAAAVSVLSHRIILSPQGKSGFKGGEDYIAHILETTDVPSMG